MRVRYGKPIKVKSLLGTCNVPFSRTSMSNITFYPRDDSSFSYGYESSRTKTVNRKANHKYFILLNTNDFTYTWSYLGIWDTNSSGYSSDNRQAPTKVGNGDYYCVISPITDASSGVPTLQYGNTDSTATLIANYALIIDLTEIGLDNLTAQEFYNKYNKYFPLIATGEEITIDDKAGQISISRLPSEYQEVEYIEGDGGQYMTQFTLNKSYTGNLTVCYKFNVTQHNSAMYFSTISATGLSAGQAYSLGYTSSTSDLYCRWNQVQGGNQVAYTIPEVLEFTRTNSIQNVTLNNISLFTHGTSSSYAWKGRIYKYWLKLNDEYLFNWIPCYRKSDNVIGLYDLISRTFATNIGTGTFLKGNNVNNTISCKVAGGSSDIYYGYNQKFACFKTSNGGGTITFDNDGIYTYTFGSNIASNAYTNIVGDDTTTLTIGHKYLLLRKVLAPHDGGFYCRYQGHSQQFTAVANTWTEDNIILTATNSGSISSYIGPSNPSQQGYQEGDVYKVRHQVIDLTDWFGVGKEPTTVQEFKEKFTKEYYGFCPTPIKLTRYQIEALPNYGYNQIANINRSTATIRGISFVKNDNNTLTITGTSQQADNISIGNMEIIEGHKYYGFTNVISGSLSTSTYWIKWVTANYGKDIGAGVLFTATSSANPAYCSFYVEGANININTKIQMMLIDLTDWYGAGDEPATIEEFKATFPNKYYPYSKKRLLNKYMINKMIN